MLYSCGLSLSTDRKNAIKFVDQILFASTIIIVLDLSICKNIRSNEAIHDEHTFSARMDGEDASIRRFDRVLVKRHFC